MAKDGRAEGSKQATTRRQKTVSIDDHDAHAEVRPLLVELLANATSLRPQEARATVDIILKAATTTTALNATRSRVTNGPTRREHAAILEGLDLGILETEINRVLWESTKKRLPPGNVQAAVDLNLQPYHGHPHEDENELYRGPAKSGTTWFHAFATLYIIARNKRYTVAVRFVRGTQTSTKALISLLTEAFGRGFRVRIVYADKAFATIEGLTWLQEHVPAYVIPLPLKGRKAKSLCKGRGGYWTDYTLENQETKARVTVRVAVAVKRNAEKYHGRKKGNAYFPYIAYGLQGKTPARIDRLYRNRGGIESSYKLVNRARARTSSRNPAIRLFYYAVAVFLQNAWVRLRWMVSRPKRGRGGRDAPKGFFPFSTYLDLVGIRLRRLLGEKNHVIQLAEGA